MCIDKHTVLLQLLRPRGPWNRTLAIAPTCSLFQLLILREQRICELRTARALAGGPADRRRVATRRSASRHARASPGVTSALSCRQIYPLLPSHVELVATEDRRGVPASQAIPASRFEACIVADCRVSHLIGLTKVFFDWLQDVFVNYLPNPRLPRWLLGPAGYSLQCRVQRQRCSSWRTFIKI